jgi:hypothetical protein
MVGTGVAPENLCHSPSLNRPVAVSNNRVVNLPGVFQFFLYKTLRLIKLQPKAHSLPRANI